MRQQLLPADHADIGQSFKNLAALYYDQKELEKAEPLYDKALQIKLKVRKYFIRLINMIMVLLVTDA